MPRPPFHRGKVVFVGDTAVGKTSIISRYRKGTFEAVKSTITGQGSEITVTRNGLPVAMTIYDTAGQEDYRSLVPLYARGAHVAVIVYAEDSPTSFEHVHEWFEYLQSSATIPHVILVGNKADQPSAVPAEDSDALAHRHNFPLIKTSALTGQQIDELFETLAEFVDGDSAVESEKLIVVDISKSNSPEDAAKCSC